MGDIFFAITPIKIDKAPSRVEVIEAESKAKGETDKFARRDSQATTKLGDSPQLTVEELMRQVDEFQLQSDLDLIETLQMRKSLACEKLKYGALQHKQTDRLLYEALKIAKVVKDAINTYHRRKKAAEAEWLEYWNVDRSGDDSDGMITTWI